MRKAALSTVLVLALLATGDGVAGAAEVAASIPAPLRPWTAWVLDSEEGKKVRCPAHAGDSDPVCAWPARIALDLQERAGTFRQEWTIFKEGFVALPGDNERWPRDIEVDGRRVPMVDHGGDPQVFLRAGRHLVTGAFAWDSLPESLTIPTETGLVDLTVNRKRIAFPMREADGRVFLGKSTEEKVEEEKVDITVYRKLSDTVPQLLTTRLGLAVSGKSRELVLGRALPDGFQPRSVDSKLPLRFEGDGRARVQARPGRWNIEIVAHKTAAEKSIARPLPDGPWKEGEEVWAFEAVPNLRAVTVAGPPSIDPAQTLMPTEWRNLPAYTLAPGAVLTLVEQRRGDADPAPERLEQNRTLWLDADGGGFSARDTLAGEFTRAWRLDARPGTRLGRLAIGGQEQFITRHGPGGREGVEIRDGRATIEADSRIARSRLTVPATTLDHDLDKLSTTLNLPLGWDLLHASGVDRVSGSWVERWSLGQLFLLLVLVLVVARLYGWRLGALALVTLGLTLVHSAAPAILWLFVIAGEVLVRVLKAGRVLIGARVARVGMWLVLVVTAAPFAESQLRFALHPASALDARYRAFLAEPEESKAKVDMLRAPERFVVYSMSGDRNLAAEARNAGILGVLHQGQEGRMGKAQGQAGADAVDVPGGLALVGTGTGGGGTGERTVGLDSIFGRDTAATTTDRYALKGDRGGEPAPQAAAPPPRLSAYDPSIVVQTGEGLPRQTWRTATLAFHGPVKSDHQLRLYLVPPWLARLLAVAQVALLAALVWLLVRRPLRLKGGLMTSRPFLVGLTALVLLVPLAASAEGFPPKETLDSLKERLLRAPECAPDCVALNDMAMHAAPARLNITLQVSAAAPSAIALPGDISSWSPTEVRIDGKPARALERASSGQLWVAVESGVHAVDLAGPLPGRDSIQIPLPMRPRHAAFTVRGFELGGIHEDGAVDESISLSRIASAAEQSEFSEAGPALPPFLRVERTLLLGLKWEVETKVTRESSADSPLLVEIPLLPGEAVTTAEVRTEKVRDAANLSFGPGEREKMWKSTLTETRAIHLRADPATASRWSEIWRLQASPIWHVDFSGVPPVRADATAAMRAPEWRPWPGEEVHISVAKPGGAPGRTLTIDASVLDVEPGLHGSRVTLALELRSSRGTEHRIALPAGAEVKSLRRDNLAQPIRQQDQDLVLSIPPGKHDIIVDWRQPIGVSTFFRVPPVDLRAPSANPTVHLRLLESPRWILWLGGSFVGPAVGLWAVVAIILLVGIALGRSRLTPLRTRHWLLLGLGLTQVGWMAALLVVAFLLGVGWRARRAPDETQPGLYNLGQFVLAGLLLASIGVLGSAIDSGLWRLPDSFIAGNNSVPHQLTWSQNRAGAVLEQPFMLSAPIWAYRVAVMAWTLWLAAAAIRWSPWIWSCANRHGLWRSPPPIAVPPAGTAGGE